MRRKRLGRNEHDDRYQYHYNQSRDYGRPNERRDLFTVR